jgi:hypothetical protein
MAQNLLRFLSNLAVSPEKMASYLENPDAAMQQAELTAEESAALKSRDSAKVYASLVGRAAPGEPVSASLVKSHSTSDPGHKPPLICAVIECPPLVCAVEPEALQSSVVQLEIASSALVCVAIPNGKLVCVALPEEQSLSFRTHK